MLSSKMTCRWHFILPPTAVPYFGGLWEIVIKSVKFHLKQVIGTQLLMYEEFQILITRVEGVLSSWSLISASTDPHGLGAFIPGHFLIGQPMEWWISRIMVVYPGQNQVVRVVTVQCIYTGWKFTALGCEPNQTTGRGQRQWFMKSLTIRISPPFLWTHSQI